MYLAFVVFKLFDRNGDGFIDCFEFEVLIYESTVTAAVSADADATALLASMTQSWTDSELMSAFRTVTAYNPDRPHQITVDQLHKWLMSTDTATASSAESSSVVDEKQRAAPAAPGGPAASGKLTDRAERAMNELKFKLRCDKFLNLLIEVKAAVPVIQPPRMMRAGSNPGGSGAAAGSAPAPVAAASANGAAGGGGGGGAALQLQPNSDVVDAKVILERKRAAAAAASVAAAGSGSGGADSKDVKSAPAANGAASASGGSAKGSEFIESVLSRTLALPSRCVLTCDFVGSF